MVIFIVRRIAIRIVIQVAEGIIINYIIDNIIH